MPIQTAKDISPFQSLNKIFKRELFLTRPSQVRRALGLFVQQGLNILRHDGQGFYYCANSEDGYWVCPKCGQHNAGTYYGQLCSNSSCRWPVWDDNR